MTVEEEVKKETTTSDPVVGGIDRMYQTYDKLNNAEDKSTLEAEYRQFMEAAHGSDKEKRLASQFITRFIEYFPNTYDDAVSAMLDLCEEDDPIIRKQVIKDLLSICKKVKPEKTYVAKIADVFCQLMLYADTPETQTIEGNFTSLFNIDARGTLAGIFAQLRDEDEVAHEVAFRILSANIRGLSSDIATLSFQRSLYGEIKRSVKYLSEDEFKIMLDLLMSPKFNREGQTEIEPQQIMDLLYARISPSEMLNVEDPSAIGTLLATTDRALTLLNATVLPNPLVVYYFSKVLPRITQIVGIGDDKSDGIQLNLLKRLAELVLNVTTMEEEDVKTCLNSAIQLTFDLLPPAKSDAEVEPAPDQKVTINYSLIECSVFFMYKMGALLPTYLPSAEGFEDLCTRLISLHRPATSYKGKLHQAFKNHESKPLDLTQLENKKKVIALKVLKNLNTLIRALIEEEIKYGHKLTLSWKPLSQPKKPEPLLKNSVPNSSGVNASGARNIRSGKDRELLRYQPPGGKYSRGGAFGSYSGSRGGVSGGSGGRGGYNKGGFGGRGRGSFRGNNIRRF